MLVPTVDVKQFEKYGFRRCKGSYGKAGCYYLCIARGIKMLFVSKLMFAINPWNEGDPRIHKHPNCRYTDKRDAYDIMYLLIKDGLLKSEWERRNE